MAMDLTGAKNILMSKTFWGVAASAAGQVAPMLGIGVSQDEVSQMFASGQNAVVALLQFGGLALALYGRITATKQVTVLPTPSNPPPASLKG